MAPVTSASAALAASSTESAPAHLAQSVRRYFARLRVVKSTPAAQSESWHQQPVDRFFLVLGTPQAKLNPARIESSRGVETLDAVLGSFAWD